MYSVQLMGVAFSLIMIISVFLMVRARMIREKYSLVWFLIGLFTLVMSVFKDLMDWFSALIGVDYAPSAFFAILIASAYLLLLNMSVSISGMKMHNKTLTQELGLTKLRLEELEKRMNGGESQSNI
ncbi:MULTISPECIES: DUF2304 domain-containing protein [Paenibacillus]|uniref:DUF2304 domain-containing protein n=1 Tax=Paenibacillus baimaensis TaxID=2982185 RepID=A0ABT2UAE5_9BACL|nr:MULTISPECIES: DUF2304 domain-containing protein [Paenibacillus]MCU6791618.1 DUF2304 domain-containing protein [Paenibacillus sp. WQ 127069]OMF16307.1 hypothetical protein BK127_12845 [Paenibacillus sp. FSL H7-0331]